MGSSLLRWLRSFNVTRDDQGTWCYLERFVKWSRVSRIQLCSPKIIPRCPTRWCSKTWSKGCWRWRMALPQPRNPNKFSKILRTWTTLSCPGAMSKTLLLWMMTMKKHRNSADTCSHEERARKKGQNHFRNRESKDQGVPNHWSPNRRSCWCSDLTTFWWLVWF